MKCSFILTIVEIYASAAIEILYVLPDNSTSAVSCPSQPCATLSQYVLDNGTLPVVSNVEYHFLPGEHHVPANLMLKNLHNFSMIGIVNNSSSSVVLIGCLQRYVFDIMDSQFVVIENVMFKHCGILPDGKKRLINLKLSCCFSCTLQDVTLIQYGLTSYNLIGESYLHNVKIETLQFLQSCCQAITLLFISDCQLLKINSTYMHQVTMDQISIYNNHTKYIGKYNMGLTIHTERTKYHLKIILKNSYLCNMGETALFVIGKYSLTTQQIFVINCTFKFIDAAVSIDIVLLPFNRAVNFINCEFLSNKGIIRVRILICMAHICEINISNASFTLISTSINIVRCQFIHNSNRLLTIDNKAPALKGKVLLKSVNITHNVQPNSHLENDIISIIAMNVYIAGIFNVTKNTCQLSIIQFELCDIMFTGRIIFSKNRCAQAILLDTYIKVMEYANMTFTNNLYYNNLIAIENAVNYHQPYPFCFFQYVTLNSNMTQKELLTHYFIDFTQNYRYPRYTHVINLNGTKLYSKNTTSSLLFCHYMSHCRWLPQGAFYGNNPETVNQQIVRINDPSYCNYHKQICHCYQNKEINCSNDMLGTVYPGQTLQTSLCNMYISGVSTITYAEVNNINLPNSTCKIAHQSQLINIIGNHSNTVNYTIISSIPGNNRCELFLTASPFLNQIYDVFYVELLPCPVGFTLQDGICNCDPILPASIDKCYIDNSTIRRPANAWIIAYSQAKYLISDCPMDYCLPYSSNINLLNPDLQCQFNRTGILCSQCQHHLSMVLGSSRCMKCTNVYIILIIIIVTVAGVILVILLYLLNLTVTNGTINGIIFYSNIVSINDSIFLINDNVLEPLKIFISFANLDLGIEACFYNGMDSYAKMWLQLFFPFYLIIIAASIIIASRYSYRILRLTYTRSLPVLATLFLLSYTGVLRTVLTVLFSYSTITHLPSGHKQIVWSIDASVPLFGVKFTILFITCLLLFLLLIPFNITLLFTRHLLQFRMINHFKPLLDAFQGPYKDRYYYWVAVHITLRCIFFGLYGFQIRARLIIAVLILISFIGYHGYIYPYKNKLVNIQERLLLINLTMMYAVSYQSSEKVFSIVSNVMISLAFIQFCSIVFYHFLTYTCHCDIVSKIKLMIQGIAKKNKCQALNNLEVLDIPERTYNYSEYQDGLVSDDFI